MTDLSPPGNPSGRGRSLTLGALAFAAVVATLGDPGITSDEPLDTRVGRRYVAALGKWAEGRWSPFDASDVDYLFVDNAQHPPLGRLLLGLASTAAEPLEPLLGGADPFGVHAARLAPALAFALLVAGLARCFGRWYGPASGWASGVGLLLLPRPFAHAHFATLDTFVALFWIGTLLAAIGAVERRRPALAALGAGAVWGLALLTKIHAWLLPPLVLGWFLLRLGPRRGLLAFAAWLATGLLVFFAGWPWLWHAPTTRLAAFLGTSVERLALRVQYFDRVYLDRDVPWHYPWFYSLATVPVGLLLLAGIGLVTAVRRRDERPAGPLLIAAILLLLVVFSTRAPVYDGERLFLPAFPLLAGFAGLGFATLWGRARQVWLRGLLVVALGAQGSGLVALHPFQLSYYNALVGGLRGAERLGLELTYWGDAIDGVLLRHLEKRARPGDVVALVPSLHHIQGTAFLTPALNERGIRLRDERGATRADWLLVYRRTAYWPPDLAPRLAARPPVATRRRQGVWLAGLWPAGDLPPSPPAPVPTGRR